MYAGHCLHPCPSLAPTPGPRPTETGHGAANPSGHAPPALTPAFPLLAGTAGVALAACCVVFYVVWVAPCGPDEVEHGGCCRGEAPICRARRLMGWEGGYFLRSEIKKERDA